MTRPGPTLVVLAAYGIGILAIVLVGVLAHRQIPTPGPLAGMALITAGVVIGNVSGPAHG
jgi:small multidrug resistance pump